MLKTLINVGLFLGCGWHLGVLLADDAPASEIRHTGNVCDVLVIGQNQIRGDALKIVEHRSGDWSPELSADEQAVLFAIAVDTLQWCVQKSRGAFAMEKYALTPKLKMRSATFVTLKLDGELRGCIGSLEPVEPLFMSVHNNAVNAALRDFRFSPVQAAELPRLKISVSILSPNRDIPGPDAFQPGRHGIIMHKGAACAVFLPEVAVEQGWTRETTLSYLSRKAGLSADAWREGAQFQVFESVVLAQD